MSIRTNANQERAEEDGDTELTLVAITYTGNRSLYGPQGMSTEGGYPALDQFQSGETKLVMVPSERLGWWENHSAFEVDYTPETIARSLLERNYIPEQIVGPSYNVEVRDRLIESLGLDPFSGEDDLREQLREVAGMSEEEDENAVEETSSREESLSTVGRSVLIKVANSYDDIDEALEEADKSSVSHLGQTELASFLADKDDDEVDRRVETAKQGGDI
jgi:hypothetical protein